MDSGPGGGAAGVRELLEAEARGRGRLEEAPGGAGPAGRTELGSELRGKREVAGAAAAGAEAEEAAGAEAEGEPDGVTLRCWEGAIRFREEGFWEGACW